MFYEHALAHIAGQEVDYEDEEPPPLDMPGVEVLEDGARVYRR